MSNDSNNPAGSIVLEAPPEPESPVAGLGDLFAGDEAGSITAKFTIADSMLKLLTKDLTFHDFMREVLMCMMKVVKSEAGSVLEIDPINQCFFFRTVVGQSSDRLANFEIPLGQGIVGHVAESRQPMAVANVEENKAYLKSIQNAIGFETRNLVAVPVMVRGRVYGVIELLNRVGEENYTPADLELLTYACDSAAKAIEVRMMLAYVKKKKEETAADDASKATGEAA